MKCFIKLLFVHILITNGNIYKYINNKFLKNDIIYKIKNDFKKILIFNSSNINIFDIALLFN